MAGPRKIPPEIAHRLAEAERMEAQLRAVLDSVSDCYYALDRDWKLTEFSRSAEQYFNLKREDVVGRCVFDIFPSGRNQPYEDVCRAAMDRGEQGRLEVTSAFRPDRVVEMRTAPMEDGISVAITDITERRRAESAQRRQTRELQAVLDAAPVAIWIARDALASAITGNHFANALLRLPDADAGVPNTPPEQVRYRILDAGGAPLPREAFPITRAARGEQVTAVELRIAHPDGVVIDLFGNAVTLRDRAGQPRGAVAAFADVTHLKSVERDLTDLTRTLEQRIAEAVAEQESALEQLHEAQKTEALGQIAGGVAHDFNNLLSPIVGGLDMLKRRGLSDARAGRLIDGALDAAERARTLVQRMLAFARRQPLQRAPVAMGDLVESLRTLLASSLGARIRLALEVAPDTPPAFADANQLELALLNLALNARDAMPDGGTLTISAAPQRGRVRIEVTDTGTGMDAATLKRAVEPFFSTKGVGKGTGLGLSMVHGLAAQLGGQLEISSTPGLGTSVVLILPAAEQPVPALGAALPTITAMALGRVLLVDDEEPVRETTRAMLEDLGYAVGEAGSAHQALAAIEADEPYDWVVTDHMMPGMSGADLARVLRQRHPGLGVLIISGYADVDEIAPDLPRLAKPFRQTELAARLAAKP